MTSCNFFNPKGEPSGLYEALEAKYGANIASKTFELVTSQVFENTHPNVTKDTNGEVTIQEIESLGIPELVKSRSNISTITTASVKSVLSDLTTDFKVAGVTNRISPIEMEVTREENSAAIGTDNPFIISLKASLDLTSLNSIESNSKQGLVALSVLPQTLKDAGVNLAKKSTLHDVLSKVYDTLSEKDFNNELLMLALSNEDLRNTPEWVLYHNKVVEYLTDTFDLSHSEVLDFLDKYLTNPNVNDLVNTLTGLRKKRMIDQRIIKNTLKPLAELVDKLERSIVKKIKIYFSNMSEVEKSGSASYVHLENLRQLFEEYKTTQNVNAIVGFVSEMGFQIGLIEKRLAKLELDLLTATEVTDESLYRLYQYISVFDNLEDIQILLSEDSEFARELNELFKDDPLLKKFRNIKAYTADLLARNVSIKAKTSKITNIFLAEKLTSLGRGRVEASYKTKYRQEFDRRNKTEKLAADKKSSLKRAYESTKESYVNSRVKENKRIILQEEADRISSLLQSSPKDISYFERMFLDRNALGDDLIQIVSEMIDKADYEVDRATTEVYKNLFNVTSKYEKEVRNTNSQVEKYDELISPNVFYDENTGSVTANKDKVGYLTSLYYPQVYEKQRELWSQYYEALRSDSANEIEERRLAAEQFSRENFDTPFSQAYYDVIDSLKANPQAEAVFNSYKTERSVILKPYKGKTLPEVVQVQLDVLEAKYKELFSINNPDGTRKVGEALEVALTIGKFRAKFGGMYNKDFKSAEFTSARAKAVSEGREQEWLDENTFKKTGKDFFAQYYRVLALDPYVKAANEDYREVVKEFKALQVSDTWTKGESDKLKLEIKTKFEEFLQAVANAKHPDIKKFMQDNLVFTPTKKFTLGKDDYVKDIAGINNGGVIPLPIYSTIESTDDKYIKRKPKAKWYISSLKPTFLKDGKTEYDEVVPKDKWLNPQYDKIQNTPSLKEAYDNYVRILEESDSFLLEKDRLLTGSGSNRIIKLPTVAKSSLYEIIGDQGIVNYVKTKLDRFKKDEPTEPGFGSDDPINLTQEDILSDISNLAFKDIAREVNILTDEAGEPAKRVPVNFRFKAKDKEASYDLPTIIALNYQMSRNYKEKSDIVFMSELVKTSIAERDVVKTAPSALEGVKTYIDALTGKTIPRPVTTKGEDSNAFKALQSMIDDRVYGLSSTSSFKMAQMANAISKYTADVLLIGNYMSAGTNLLTGYLYNFIEASAGRHFDSRDLRKAQTKYYSDTLSIANDVGRRVKVSKTNLLNERFTVLTDWRAVGEHFIESTKLMQLAKFNSLHFMSNMAEHSLQSTASYAMLNHIKVMNKDKQFIAKDGTVTEDVDLAMTLDEAYTVEGHNLILHKDAYYTTVRGGEDLNLVENSKEIEFLVSRLIKDVNADMQGQYNVRMKSEIQRAWWGQLIMLLRKFAPRGIHRRFRSFGSARVPFDSLIEDDKFYSRAQGVYNEGYYTTSVRLLAELYRDAKVLKWQLLSYQGLAKLNKLRGLKLEKLEDWQRSNLKKTTRDLLITSSLYIIGMTAASLKDDEDDELTKAALVAASFYSIRGFKELTTFINPNEMLSTLRTPSIALTMVNRVMMLLGQLGADSINLTTDGDFERYKTGRRKGETKLYKKVEDVVPLLKNVDRDMEEALSWFLNKRAY